MAIEVFQKKTIFLEEGRMEGEKEVGSAILRKKANRGSINIKR